MPNQNDQIPKIPSHSKDLTEDNLHKLQALFPQVFSEGKIDFEALKATLGDHLHDEDGERYQMTWAGKSKACNEARATTSATLRPCQEESKHWDTTQNLYIEGDNLEVLKILQKAYHQQVKMIYIDPPYNTGKDFVYKDNYKAPLDNFK